MRLELEIGTNELGHDLIEQFFVWKLKELEASLHKTTWHHPDDKKLDRKLAKACRRLLKYYGARDA